MLKIWLLIVIRMFKMCAKVRFQAVCYYEIIQGNIGEFYFQTSVVTLINVEILTWCSITKMDSDCIKQNTLRRKKNIETIKHTNHLDHWPDGGHIAWPQCIQFFFLILNAVWITLSLKGEFNMSCKPKGKSKY